jgi:hypothetical protein
MFGCVCIGFVMCVCVLVIYNCMVVLVIFYLCLLCCKLFRLYMCIRAGFICSDVRNTASEWKHNFSSTNNNINNNRMPSPLQLNSLVLFC